MYSSVRLLLHYVLAQVLEPVVLVAILLAVVIADLALLNSVEVVY